MTFRTEQLSVGESGRGDDRLAVIASPDRVLIGVFDGAGGSGRGSFAAEAALKLLRERGGGQVLDVVELLRNCDLALAREGSGGETTGVVATIDDSGIVGASVETRGMADHTDKLCRSHAASSA